MGIKKNGKHGWPESQATWKQFSTKRVRTHLPYQVPSLQWHDNVMAISPRIQIAVDHMGKVVHGQAAKSLSICLKATSSVAMECLGLGWFRSRLSCDGQNMGKTQNFCLNKLKSYEKLMQVTKTAISPSPRPRPGAARTDSATVFLTTYYCISGSRGNNGVIAPIFFRGALKFFHYPIPGFYKHHVGCGCTLVLCYHRLVSTGWFKGIPTIDSDDSYLNK